jgi:hypothetical protein
MIEVRQNVFCGLQLNYLVPKSIWAQDVAASALQAIAQDSRQLFVELLFV